MKFLSKHHQKGVSFTGLLIILAMLGCFFIFGLRVFPLYTEYFAVKQSMKSVANQPYSMRSTPKKVRSLLLKNLELNSVYSFNEQRIKKVAKTKKKGTKRDLIVKYETSNRLFGKIYLTMKIDETIELSGGGK